MAQASIPPLGTDASRRGGFALALGAILIWAFWPVWTRHDVIRHLSPADIVFLRFGVGGVLFLPFLLMQSRSLRPRAWLVGLGLAACQGAPFALLVATGLRYAPANHAAALTTGVSPLFAALLGAFLFSERIAKGRVLGLAMILIGAGALAYASGAGPAALGDSLFVAAAAIASIYIVCVSRSGLTAFQAAAMVAVFSMIFYVPAYLLFGEVRLSEAPWTTVAWQGFYQGVLMALVSFLLLNRAIARLGASRASAMIALVPVLSLLLAIPLLGEWPTQFESISVALVSAGVYLAAQLRAQPRPQAAATRPA
jgi:drug/metabolite transporter (DMT)-like permease